MWNFTVYWFSSPISSHAYKYLCMVEQIYHIEFSLVETQTNMMWWGAVEKKKIWAKNAISTKRQQKLLTTHKCVQTNKLKWKWKQKGRKKEHERIENANNVWVLVCVFSGMANFGTKFKSKCQRRGRVYRQKGKKNFSAKTKPKFHYRFTFLYSLFSSCFPFFLFFSSTVKHIY